MQERSPSGPTTKTVERVIHFTDYWGYDGCIVVNLYPYIERTQNEMWNWRQSKLDEYGTNTGWYASNEMQDNLAQIEEAGRCSCLRVAAFGTKIKDPDWARACIERFERPVDFADYGWEFSEDCVCLRIIKGMPAHPNPRPKDYIPDHQQPIPWRPRPRGLSTADR
jgi:Protein of unknown function (DUF1643)